MHELVVVVVALVGPQEIEVPSMSAVTAEFSGGTIHLFMTQVVV